MSSLASLLVRSPSISLSLPLRYTGSTTGTSRDNDMCSRYTPITWQVDRTCHKVSAKAWDQMCKKMKEQKDDMSDDTHAHGARAFATKKMVANNQQSRK